MHSPSIELVVTTVLVLIARFLQFRIYGIGSFSFVYKMVYARGLVVGLCVVIAILRSLVPVAAEARVLTREELAPLLAKKVVIPNVAKAPQATPWPEEFTIAFSTDGGVASGVLAYDWGNKQQAIVHGEGSSHCVGRGSAGVCYILENSRGTFEVDPVSRRCELTNPGVGTVPPTWAVHGVFAGVEEVNGVQCNRFNYPPTMHAWLETVDGGLPCAFLFPNPSLTYYFDRSTLKLGKPALNMFSVPDYCPQDITYEEVRETSLRADQ
jgi:hypothetical protein